MNISSFLRSQAKGILCLIAMVVLLGMVWVQTAPTSTRTALPSTEAVGKVADVPPSTETKTVDSAPVKSAPSTATPAADPPGTDPVPVSKDEEYRAQMVGCWFHIESGEHWIENYPDGTSRLLIKLDFVSSLLYGKQMDMELTWEVKDGVLTHTIVKGVPEANVASLVKDFGKSRSSRILEVTPERMLLGPLSKKDSKDLWTRSPLPKEWVDTAAK